MTARENALAEAAIAAAAHLHELSAQEIHELRRMTTDMPAPDFLHLAARHPGTIGLPGRQDEWVAIVRMLAMLTETAPPDIRNPVHDPDRALGAFLCDGGNPSWSPFTGRPPRPALTERRMVHLLAARGQQRVMQLERAVRALARSRSPEQGLDVGHLALAILDDSGDSRIRLAETYYDRLDGAVGQPTKPADQKGNR